MNSPFSGVCGLLHAKLKALLAEFDTVAVEMKKQQEHNSVQRVRFQQAKGETMFGADGTSVHTRNERWDKAMARDEGGRVGGKIESIRWRSSLPTSTKNVK